jgi:hypothetical protein
VSRPLLLCVRCVDCHRVRLLTRWRRTAGLSSTAKAGRAERIAALQAQLVLLQAEVAAEEADEVAKAAGESTVAEARAANDDDEPEEAPEPTRPAWDPKARLREVEAELGRTLRRSERPPVPNRPPPPPQDHTQGADSWPPPPGLDSPQAPPVPEVSFPCACHRGEADNQPKG